MTAKTGGSTSPCTARQKMSAGKLVANPSIMLGTTSTNIAATITRFLPSTSATAPVNGAVTATAKLLTVIMVATSAALALNSCESRGRIDCGAYKLTKAQ